MAHMFIVERHWWSKWPFCKYSGQSSLWCRPTGRPPSYFLCCMCSGRISDPGRGWGRSNLGVIIICREVQGAWTPQPYWLRRHTTREIPYFYSRCLGHFWVCFSKGNTGAKLKIPWWKLQAISKLLIPELCHRRIVCSTQWLSLINMGHASGAHGSWAHIARCPLSLAHGVCHWAHVPRNMGYTWMLSITVNDLQWSSMIFIDLYLIPMSFKDWIRGSTFTVTIVS